MICNTMGNSTLGLDEIQLGGMKDNITDIGNCPPNYACLTRENPNHGLTSFDNILLAGLAIFQMFTMDGWESIMYEIEQVTES